MNRSALLDWDTSMVRCRRISGTCHRGCRSCRHGDTKSSLAGAADVISVPCYTSWNAGVDARSEQEAPLGTRRHWYAMVMGMAEAEYCLLSLPSTRSRESKAIG